MKLSYMPLFAYEELAKTTAWENDVTGIYFRLLCGLWINGAKLANNPRELARLTATTPARWQKAAEKMGDLLQISDGFITLEGLPDAYEKALQKHKNLSENGKKGGRPKRAEGAENKESEKADALPGTKQETKADGLTDTKAEALAGLKHVKSISKSNNDKDIDGDGRRETVDNPALPDRPLPASACHDDVMAALQAVFQTYRLKLPMDVHLVSTWIEGGADLERDILPALKGVCERVIRRGIKPPASFAYFQNAIQQAVAKHHGGGHG